jgi:hypothetical protein
MDYVQTYKEGDINYGKDATGGIYKNDRLVDPLNYKYIPTAIGGQRIDPTPTTTPTGTTVPPATTQLPEMTQTFNEGGTVYTRDASGNIYKNSVMVTPDNYKYIPSAIGGTRDGTVTSNQTATNVDITQEQKDMYKSMTSAQLDSIVTANSAAWHNATPEQRKQLEAINRFINGELRGLTFDNGTGKWSSATGTGGTPIVSTPTGTGTGTGTDTGTPTGTGGTGFQFDNSKYGDTLDQLVQQLLQRMTGEGFKYDPNTDASLKTAQDSVARKTREQMNARGILNSTITQDTIAEQFGNLTAQYEQIAQGRYDSETDRLMAFSGFISDLDSKDFDKAVTMWETDMREREFQYTKQQDELNRQWDENERTYTRERQGIMDAWDKVNEIGYVDNETSEILGLPVGTKSLDVQQRIEDRLNELTDARTERKQQLEDEARALANDKELYDYKLDREAEVLRRKTSCTFF